MIELALHIYEKYSTDIYNCDIPANYIAMQVMNKMLIVRGAITCNIPVKETMFFELTNNSLLPINSFDSSDLLIKNIIHIENKKIMSNLFTTTFVNENYTPIFTIIDLDATKKGRFQELMSAIGINAYLGNTLMRIKKKINPKTKQNGN
jgi:hypothetical protein